MRGTGVVLSLLGSAGVGAVWGWLAGITYGSSRLPQRSIPLLVLATLPVCTSVLLVAGPLTLPAFGAAAVSAFLIYTGWRLYLSRRFGQPAVRHFGG
jgi:hypothetical protein